MAQYHTVEEVKTVSINEEELTLPRIVAVARHFVRVQPFAGPKRERVEELRRYVEERWFSDDSRPRYGFNTGVGVMKTVKISEDKIKRFQELYVKSHCVGVGEPLDVEVVRGAMLLLANALAKGYSGIRVVLVDKLIEMLNKRIHPVVPEQGSLGASGDLAQLTHVASVLVGEPQAQIWIGNDKPRLEELMDANGVVTFSDRGEEVVFETVELHGKEAVSLTNATAVMLSVAALFVHDTEVLLKNADVAAALSLEAMMAEQDAFAPQLHEIRNQKGQITTAANIRALIQDSRRMTAEARRAFSTHATEQKIKQNLKQDARSREAEMIQNYKLEYESQKDRIQDAYSLRCVPQVHGACKDAFEHVRNVVEREIAAVTDNPVIFPHSDGDGYDVRSGGNFHGEPLALAADFIAIALAEIGSISERRMFRLLSPGMSFGLPHNLTGGAAGLNSGYMLVQYTGAQLVSENKILAHPASVDSIPTSDNQEDHVSMGWTAARKARQILRNVQNLVAMELMCAVQGVHLSAQTEACSLKQFPLGKGTGLAFEFLTRPDRGGASFPIMIDDEYLHTKIAAMRELSVSGGIVRKLDNLVPIDV